MNNNQDEKKPTLLFGIPELDRLLDLKRGNFYRPTKLTEGHLNSIALLGSYGTGKSVFALHLVSRYFADTYTYFGPNKTQEPPPKVLYVSTDLGYEKANTVWHNFALNLPYLRDIPCERASDRRERKTHQGLDIPEFELEKLPPSTDKVAKFLGQPRATSIGFIDMAGSSAGDDWGYMIRALSLLNGCGHLVVIDSVAGFETLTGNTDAYGETSTRRARIARVIRAAQERCHLMFVVEEAQEDVELPEEFVSDIVIRLRRRTAGGSTHRTLEIEKARGRAHAGGEHPYNILDGFGSSTGAWENPDEPLSRRHSTNSSDDEVKQPLTNNYVQIYYSLQYRNQRIKARPGPGSLAPQGKRASFGIQHLDDLLGGEARQKGLRCGKICSLIGDAGTGKSSLAYSFLCEGFRSYAEQLALLTTEIEEGLQSINFDRVGLQKVFWKIENWLTASDIEAVGAPRVQLSKITSPQALVEAAKDCELNQREIAESHVLDKDKAKHVLVSDNPLHISQSWNPTRKIHDTDWPELPLRRVQYPWKWHEQSPTEPMAIADWLLRHPACASPGILIATSDVKSDELAERFVEWLRPTDKDKPNRFDERLYNYIAQHLICRRLEADDATAPILFHIIERAILEAQRLLFGPILPNTAALRTVQSWRIRLVIDNLRIVRDMYPAVRNDPLFLPLLAFYLGREGITTLIIDTDSGRPDKDPSDEINRELRSLVAHQLYTWQVPFFGQKRIAIAALPSVTARHKGIVREVKVENDELSDFRIRPQVDPHFELYSGLEEGKPQAVPLSVILYAETPAFQEYAQRENLFFKQVFPSVGISEPSSDIVVGRSTVDYETLRDFCHMPTDLRLNHSLVFQVDGYWGLQGDGSLEDQRSYLEEATRLNDSRSMEDPFHLFQPLNKSQSPDNSGKVPFKYRYQYFQNKYYKHGRNDKPITVDRIPFTWDFGLLLCKIDPWRLAADKPLKMLAESLVESSDQKDDKAPPDLTTKLTVGKVWNALPKTIDPLLPKDKKYETTLQLDELTVNGAKPTVSLDSWRVFFEAAKVVANVAADRLGHAVQPFDFVSMAGDSVSSFILEIWCSEIWERGKRIQEHLKGEVCGAESYTPGDLDLISLLAEKKSISDTYQEFKDEWTKTKAATKPKLRDYLDGYSLELYMTWLLLLEVLDFNSFRQPNNFFDFRLDRSPVQEAVAARHWYKTACTSAANGEQTGHPSELMIAVRLPGHFAVRGDWFLATAKGSRSTRLAARALDVLSSRRANIVRLQMGLGLPTRDILEDSQIGQLRTALRGPDVKGVTDNVKCETLFRKLGAKHCDETDSEIESKDFYWLWRSRLQNYDRHSRVWRKWLHRVFVWTHHYHRQHSSEWIGGFKPYDQLSRGDYSKVIDFDSFLQFAEMCDLLIAELRAATPD